jgi:tetratricopeptide (TPR) repeat protein
MIIVIGLLLTVPSQTRAKEGGASDAFAKASKFYAKGKFSKAAQFYQQAITADPEDPEFYWHLGMTQDALENFDGAIASYEKALSFNSKDKHLIYNNLGVSYGKKKLPVKAIAAFQQSVALSPSYVAALFNLGMAHYLNGDKESALKQFEKLKEIDFDVAQKLMENISERK